jgi:hypothetical protein
MTKQTVNFFMITLESISPGARMTGILEKAIKIANAQMHPNGGPLANGNSVDENIASGHHRIG